MSRTLKSQQVGGGNGDEKRDGDQGADLVPPPV